MKGPVLFFVGGLVPPRPRQMRLHSGYATAQSHLTVCGDGQKWDCMGYRELWT